MHFLNSRLHWLQIIWFNFEWVHKVCQSRYGGSVVRELKWPLQPVYLEELELERERWRLRPGDLERERRRAGERLLGERDLWGHKDRELEVWKQSELARTVFIEDHEGNRCTLLKTGSHSNLFFSPVEWNLKKLNVKRDIGSINFSKVMSVWCHSLKMFL